MVSPGENIFVITRRFFEKDIRRHFVGRVLKVNETAMRIEGYVFTFDEVIHEFVRINELRTRIVSFSDCGMILLVIPSEVDIKQLHYQTNDQLKRFLTDGKNFSLNVSEFGTHR